MIIFLALTSSSFLTFFSKSVVVSGRVLVVASKRSSSSRVTRSFDFQGMKLLAPSSLSSIGVLFFIFLESLWTGLYWTYDCQQSI
jgi:hypothetical protein